MKNLSRVFLDKHTKKLLEEIWRDWVSKLNSRLNFYYLLLAVGKCLDKSLGADATLDLCMLGEKQEFWVEVICNRKREWLDFKTDSGKDLSVEKLELLESFKDCRELRELTVELLEERGGESAELNEKEVMFLYEGFE